MYLSMSHRIIRSVVFLVQIAFIFVTECLRYRDRASLVRRLAHRLASVNVFYVKVFQAFALNQSLIDETVNNELIHFTDHAPWNLDDIDVDTLFEVTHQCDIRLQEGFEKPINAGMISLVFLGYRRTDNQPVIVKMKRRHIQRKLNDAIDNLLLSMYLLSFIPLVHKYQLAEVVHKNIDMVCHQTNFLQEVDNMHKMRENCKHLKYVKIPMANRKITEAFPDVIVMDYLHGAKVGQVAQEDYDAFAKQVVKFGIVTTVLHGTAHGDLHCGNILFIKDPEDSKYPHKIGVIDFGIVYEVGTVFKTLLFDLFTQMFEVPAKETAERLLHSGILEPAGILQHIPRQDYESILSYLEGVVTNIINRSQQANQLHIYEALSVFKEYVAKKEVMNLGIRLSDDFVKSQLVLAMSHGVTLTLCKGDFIALMDEVINELFPTAMLR